MMLFHSCTIYESAASNKPLVPSAETCTLTGSYIYRQITKMIQYEDKILLTLLNYIIQLDFLKTGSKFKDFSRNKQMPILFKHEDKKGNIFNIYFRIAYSSVPLVTLPV